MVFLNHFIKSMINWAFLHDIFYNFQCTVWAMGIVGGRHVASTTCVYRYTQMNSAKQLQKTALEAGPLPAYPGCRTQFISSMDNPLSVLQINWLLHMDEQAVTQLLLICVLWVCCSPSLLLLILLWRQQPPKILTVNIECNE